MRVNTRLVVLQIGLLFLAFALSLFLPAGTIAWPAGWVFLILFFGFVAAITAWLFQHNPGLLTERMTGLGKSDQKGWDKVFYPVLNIVFFAWLILMPLDAVRFQWSHMPTWLQEVGAILLLGSFYLFFLTFRENSFLSPAVRVQRDRGQTVISTGPYHYVRHPMYSAAFMFIFGMPLLLGSWYGVLGALVLVFMMGIRAVLEEQALRKELQGYDRYMGQVKYRLIPHVW